VNVAYTVGSWVVAHTAASHMTSDP